MSKLLNIPSLSVRLSSKVWQRRAIQWSLAVTAWCLVAWWWSGILSDRSIIDELTLQEQEVAIKAGMVTTRLSDRLLQAQSVAAILVHDPDVREALTGFGPNASPSALPLDDRRADWARDAQLAPLAKRFQQVLPAFRLKVLWLSNASGDVVAEAHASDMSPVLGLNVSDRDYFKTAQQGQPGHQFVVGRLSSMMGLFFSAPVMKDGVFQGMVGTSVGIDEFAPLMKEAQAFVTDELGVVVLGPEPEWNMHRLSTSAVMELSESQRMSRYKRTDFAPLGLEPVDVGAGSQLFRIPNLPGPLAMASQPVEGGFLTVHNIRSLGLMLSEKRAARLWSFVAMSVSGVLFLALLGGVALFAEVAHRQNRVLGRLNARLSRQANTDALTGATSRRHFLQLMSLELVRAQRHDLDVCVLSLDLDYFKRVNDTHGHAAGDAVLRNFSSIIRGELRQTDVFGRVGGEEFSILLVQTTAQGGLQMAERIRAVVESNPVMWFGAPIPVTVSIGGVHWRSHALPTVDQLLAASDRVLYQAKHEGRNRVVWQDAAAVTATESAAFEGTDLPRSGSLTVTVVDDAN